MTEDAVSRARRQQRLQLVRPVEFFNAAGGYWRARHAQRADASTDAIVCGDPTALPNDQTGYGIVDAFAAVQRALEAK